MTAKLVVARVDMLQANKPWMTSTATQTTVLRWFGPANGVTHRWVTHGGLLPMHKGGLLPLRFLVDSHGVQGPHFLFFLLNPMVQWCPGAALPFFG